MQPASVELESDRTSDPLFPLVTGLYLAVLLTPPAVLLAIQFGLRGAGRTYMLVIATLAVLTTVGWRLTARTERAAERLGSSPIRWLPGTVGLCYAFGGVASLGHLGVVSLLAMFFGLGAMGLGYALGMMARTRYTDAVTAATEILCEFEAGWPAGARRRAIVAAVPLFVVGMAGFGLVYLDQFGWALWPIQMLLPTGTYLVANTEPRSYTVTAAGIGRGNRVVRKLLPWDGFSGYTRTADALVLHRQWRLDIRLALDDLDDAASVERAIAEHLRPS
ncbi:hypothetical protein [Haloarcula salinisoli]|uniref:Uncharacterized protein n=1 Tax=Haloarcula salinisoli TaxID=2487746 RepID=A0A8J8CBX7_9EURY|nr:hypothetical protein [Halomicroarcula salinisoli]MBX0304963.1 hypothetical protein [Halomicroarcula salinisoli]